jgi:hypothetical protein
MKRKCNFLIFHLRDNSYSSCTVYFEFDSVYFRKQFCKKVPIFEKKGHNFSRLLTLGTARDLRDALAGLCSAVGSPLAGRFLESGGATATRGAGSADGAGSALDIERFK